VIDAGTVHIVIPDCQVKPGVPTDHLDWVGRWIVEKYRNRPNVKIIQLGDFADLPSLSSYDKGKRSMEGRRVLADIDASNDAFARLCAPMDAFNKAQRKHGRAEWWPERHVLGGNHEYRIVRAVEDNAQLDGLLTLDSLDFRGWQVHPFLEVVWLDGVAYSHYFVQPLTGRPVAGMIETRLKTLGHSWTAGHQQVLLHGLRPVMSQAGPTYHHGLVAGTCCLHDEEYLGPQGNFFWRGIVVCNDVRDGAYDIMTISLEFLCRRYEGVSLTEFLTKENAA